MPRPILGVSTWLVPTPCPRRGRSSAGARTESGAARASRLHTARSHSREQQLYYAFFSLLSAIFCSPKQLQDAEHPNTYCNLSAAENVNISAAYAKPSNTCIFYLIYCGAFHPSLESNFSLKRNCLIGKCTKYNYTAYKLQYCLWEYHC